MPNPVERVITILGGPTRAIAALTRADPDGEKAGVSYWTLREWRKNGRVPDSRYAVLLSRASGDQVSVAELAGLGPTPAPNGGQRSRSGSSSRYTRSPAESPAGLTPPPLAAAPLAQAA